jgi:RimJ/RimL family protein N-acetyltransferase
MRLREFVPDDSRAVHRWFNDPKATRLLLEQRGSFSTAEADAWTRRAVESAGEDRKFAIEVEGVAEPVGFTALYGLFRATAPELGILIGDRVRVANLGRTAEALTLAKAFDDYGAHRVYGRIAARNKAAKWVVTSLGWKHEATMRRHLRRLDGTIEDCEIWGVLPEDFRATIDGDPVSRA